MQPQNAARWGPWARVSTHIDPPQTAHVPSPVRRYGDSIPLGGRPNAWPLFRAK
jgi:hypothetical protein